MKKHTAAAAAVGVAGLLVASAGTAVAGHSRFGDGPFGPHEAGVHFVADAGITAGCNADGTRYCPSDNVTRAQMGTFMHRLSGNGSVPPSVNARTLDGVAVQDILGNGSAPPTVNAAALDGLTAEDLVELLTDQYYEIEEPYVEGVGGAFCDEGDTALSGSFNQLGDIWLVKTSNYFHAEDTRQDGWLFAFQDGSGNFIGEGQVSVTCQVSLANRARMSAQSTDGTEEPRSPAQLRKMLEAVPSTAKPRG
jgi:hypothetical protein